MKIHPLDNVEVRPDGHKAATQPIAQGEPILKYGMPIGHATCPIACGTHVHSHNLATNLGPQQTYTYTPLPLDPPTPFQGPIDALPTFLGFRRVNGRIGIRNDLWIIPTVGCINSLCETLARATGAIALTHPYGCSQLGEDHERTASLLAALCHHPNAGGILVVSLGCENNTLESFRERLGDTSALNIRFLRAQDPGNELERGLALLHELDKNRPTERVSIPVSELIVGLKCGGSDGFSGITANPLVGRFSDWLVQHNGSVVLSEVPEMFGAETLLMKRCRTRETFQECVDMINGFKEYYARYHQPCYENPSPGNKAGGITTLEEKSLGCVQKAGLSPVESILPYAGVVQTKGLSLLSAPGNDLVSSTALAAAGCHLILFTTGRGTPFGTVVPTLKVATNTPLAEAKPHWIDWDAMKNPSEQSLATKILAIASGEPSANERLGAQSIAIFKDGVTL